MEPGEDDSPTGSTRSPPNRPIVVSSARSSNSGAATATQTTVVSISLDHFRSSTSSTHGDAPVSASFDRLFSFADLVTFTVARQVRDNRVSDRHLRKGVATLRATRGDGVVIDPEVQAGAPCVEGTRIPTRVVAERAAVEPDDDIARYRSWALSKKRHRTVRTHVRR